MKLTKSLAAKELSNIQLRHPASDELLFDENGKAVEVVMYGTSSKQYRQAITDMQNRSLKRGKKQQSAEVMRQEGIDLLVACSHEIVNLEMEDGSPINSPTTFKALYSDDSFGWIKDQVDAALGDISNFLDK